MPTINSASVRLATTATDTVAPSTIATPLLLVLPVCDSWHHRRTSAGPSHPWGRLGRGPGMREGVGVLAAAGASHHRERSDESEAGEGGPGRRVFLGDAGPDPKASRGALDAGGLHRRRGRQRHLLEPRDPRRGDRDRLRPRSGLLSGAARVLLPDPRPDDAEPPGERPRRELPLGDLLPR